MLRPILLACALALLSGTLYWLHGEPALEPGRRSRLDPIETARDPGPRGFAAAPRRAEPSGQPTPRGAIGRVLAAASPRVAAPAPEDEALLAPLGGEPPRNAEEALLLLGALEPRTAPDPIGDEERRLRTKAAAELLSGNLARSDLAPAERAALAESLAQLEAATEDP
jgi:hypothetical protein